MLRPYSLYNRRLICAAALVILAAAARLLHLPANFSPVGAMGVFAGASMPLPIALSVSMLGLLASDAVIGYYDPILMVFVYAGLALNVVAGLLCRRWRGGALCLFGTGFLGAVLFFVVSNIGSWLALGYPRTLQGFIACYIAALPFFGNTLAGQFIFLTVMFGIDKFAVARSVSPLSRDFR